MAIAASLWFDAALERTVRDAWRTLAGHGIAGALDPSVYRPHATLGVWERMDLPAFSAALRTLAAGTPAIPLALDGIGTFANEGRVVWLRPSAGEALKSLQLEVTAIGDALGEGAPAHRRAGEWTPHVTVAWGLSEPALVDTLAFLRELPLPMRGTGAAIGIIDTPAEIELERIELRG